MTTVAFVLASWRADAPAGMERAVAASAVGLTAIGHRAVIVTADRRAPTSYAGAPVVVLGALEIPDPCGDAALRAAIDAAGERLQDELLAILTAHRVHATVYVDGLWGLGRAMPITGPTRRVLATHVIGHRTDMMAALSRAELVITPSAVVAERASALGYDTTTWRVIPNALLTQAPPPSPARRHWLLGHGPIRVLARLGPEKGIIQLLTAAINIQTPRRVEVALGAAGFEAGHDSQQRLLHVSKALAHRSEARIVPGLAWGQVPGWLAEAAAVIVPSLAETFGLVALEAMAMGTPVIAFDVDNLPTLVGEGGTMVPREQGHIGLWRAAEELLGDPLGYVRASRAAINRAHAYQPARVAELLVKAVG